MASSTRPKAPEPKSDFYELFGVPSTATEKEINTAYKRLALKYHPDRTRGDEEAAEKFKEIAAAYAVLSDPNKRRQYDLSGNDEEVQAADYEPMDMEGISSVGRVFGALIGKLGMPIATSIAQSSLSEAYDMCQNTGLSRGNPKLIPMEFGVEYKGSVEKQQSVFFMLSVPEEKIKDGLVIRCTSANKSRFKLVLFDRAGKVRYLEESKSVVSKESYTTCSLMFAPFEVSSIGDTPSIQGLKGEDIPPVFNRLDLFHITKRSIGAGDHLVGVYGDNWLRAASFSLMAIPLSATAQEEQATVLSVDAQLAHQRELLKKFKPEFMEAKEKWEAVSAKVEEMESYTNELVEARESVYENLVRVALDTFRSTSSFSGGGR